MYLCVMIGRGSPVETINYSSMKPNNEILAERIAAYEEINGPRVGDFIKLPHELWTRITHIWPDGQLQTGWGSFYFGNGYCSYSGGLNPGVRSKDILRTNSTKTGTIWFFKNDNHLAHNGANFEIPFRVYELRASANTKGLPEIATYKHAQALKKVASVTRINGNGKPYTLPLPEIHFDKEVTSEVIESLPQSIKSNFKIGRWGQVIFQPNNYGQFKKVFRNQLFETVFFNNGTLHNTLIVKPGDHLGLNDRHVTEILSSPENSRLKNIPA